ncbi:MAG: hypothetical protein JXA06_07525 [Bacteroidetes bacterium]|nr:hypothetical protein [Bacteroidota bacterium]
MRKLAAALLIAVWVFDATAQFSAGTEAGIMYDDNIDNNYLQLTDRIISASLGLDYFWTAKKYDIGISYTGGINSYSNFTDRSFLSHQLSFMYTQAYGKENATTLDINAGVSVRSGRGDFKIFDHQSYHGSALLQHDFSETTAGEAGYLLQVVRFSGLRDFNYTEHKISAQFLTTFDTKTTVILGSDFGIKIYSSQTSFINDTTAGSSGAGQGQGQGGSGQPGAGTQISTTSTTSTPTVTQLICTARVAQSIFEGTGISFTAQYQKNFRKESRYLYGSIPDDVIFDDHYGYEGLALSAVITQVLPLDSRLRFTAGRQNRLYSTLPAYDLTGSVVSDKRDDERSFYTIQLKKDFEEQGLSVYATYDHVVNSSNDIFYDYKNNAFSFGLSWLIY